MRMAFIFKNMYADGLCFYMGFPNPMPLQVLYHNHTGMETNIYRYWYGVEENHHTSMGYHTGMVMPTHVW